MFFYVEIYTQRRICFFEISFLCLSPLFVRAGTRLTIFGPTVSPYLITVFLSFNNSPRAYRNKNKKKKKKAIHNWNPISNPFPATTRSLYFQTAMTRGAGRGGEKEATLSSVETRDQQLSSSSSAPWRMPVLTACGRCEIPPQDIVPPARLQFSGSGVELSWWYAAQVLLETVYKLSRAAQSGQTKRTETRSLSVEKCLGNF